jgi:hypothetical protein
MLEEFHRGGVLHCFQQLSELGASPSFYKVAALLSDVDERREDEIKIAWRVDNWPDVCAWRVAYPVFVKAFFASNAKNLFRVLNGFKSDDSGKF